MKQLISIFLIVIAQFVAAQSEQMRIAYFEAGISDDGIKKFYNSAQSYSENTPIDKAYKGVAIAMYASLASGVDQKFEYFNRGKALLEKAVADDWYNAEIRFLRFSVQAEVPFIVGYSSNLKEDAYVVIDALEKKYIDQNSYFWKNAIKFMLSSDELNNDQKNRMQKFVS